MPPVTNTFDGGPRFECWSWFGRARRNWDSMDRQQGGDLRMRSEIAGLTGAVKSAAPAGSGLVDLTAPLIVDVRAATVFERQDRAVIEEHSSMAGTASTLALNARQNYHNRPTSSAAIGVWRLSETGVSTRWRLMTEYRRRRCPIGRGVIRSRTRRRGRLMSESRQSALFTTRVGFGRSSVGGIRTCDLRVFGAEVGDGRTPSPDRVQRSAPANLRDKSERTGRRTTAAPATGSRHRTRLGRR